MAEKKHVYLVRLNKLYHFLKEHNATITIEYQDDYLETHKKTYSESSEYNLENLFCDGCEATGSSLKDIIGERDYEEAQELGRSANINERHMDVIKSIHFRSINVNLLHFDGHRVKS